MLSVLRSVALLAMIGTSAQAGSINELPRPVYIRSTVSGNLMATPPRAWQGLQALGNWRADNLSQPCSELDNLYQRAGQGQQELAALTRLITALSNTEALIPSLKSRARAQAKINGELGGQADRLTDLVRTSVIADDIPSLLRAYATLKEHARIVQVKNRFDEPTASGYRDLNVLVRLPESDLIAEVQFHLRRIAAVKNGPEHQLYERIQRIERHALVQQRPLTDIEQAQIAKLRGISRSLYQHAWQNYLPGYSAGRLTLQPISA